MHKSRIQISIALMLTFLVGAITAEAAGYTPGLAVVVSGPSPFADCTVGGAGIVYPNAEVEPRVAVNPANPLNAIGVFQQDRWDNGGAHGLVTAYSHDGGATWGITWPHFSICAGGTALNGGDYDRSSDPWVSIGPDGTAYQVGLAVSADQVDSAILASRSTDGGATWSEPATLIRDSSAFNFNDKESVTADPARAGYAYAVWDRSRHPSDNAGFNALHSFAFRGDIMFSRTTDGGVTWEPARDLMGQNKNLWTIANQIVVLPDGTLVDVFALSQGSGIQRSPNPFTEAVIRSTDAGKTWSPRPINIAQDRSVAVTDPDTGAEVRTSDGLPDVTVDPVSGTIYVVWEDARFSGGSHNDIALSMSTDGGLTWSAPVKINATANNAAAFTPAIRVASNGAIGVTYYDFRNNTPAPGVPTDAWFTSCLGVCDNPANWTEVHLAGPFDIETAPFARGYFLGDYEGLATQGDAFLAFLVTANSGDTANRTDVLAIPVTP
jgi:hypothetical protein